MCLNRITTNFTTVSPMTVWKWVNHVGDNKFESPFQCTEYKPWQQFRHKYPITNGDLVYKGFHTFISKEAVYNYMEGNLSASEEAIIFQMLIPAGTECAIGNNGDIVSNALDTLRMENGYNHQKKQVKFDYTPKKIVNSKPTSKLPLRDKSGRFKKVPKKKK